VKRIIFLASSSYPSNYQFKTKLNNHLNHAKFFSNEKFLIVKIQDFENTLL